MCLCVCFVYAPACSKTVPFNLLERLISEMKDVELACLQDILLLSMQRAVQVVALETELPQSRLEGIVPSIVM